MFWRICAALTAAVALAGCSAAVPPDSPTPSAAPAAASAPADGVLLSDLGFRHAPEGFSVPTGLAIAERVDAANNVTLVFETTEGGSVAAYFREHLPAMGFEITADSEGSLLFTNGVHEGAFTDSDELAAVSLRTDRG